MSWNIYTYIVEIFCLEFTIKNDICGSVYISESKFLVTIYLVLLNEWIHVLDYRQVGSHAYPLHEVGSGEELLNKDICSCYTWWDDYIFFNYIYLLFTLDSFICHHSVCIATIHANYFNCKQLISHTIFNSITGFIFTLSGTIWPMCV